MSTADVARWSPEAEAAITAELVRCTLGQSRRLELDVTWIAATKRITAGIEAMRVAIAARILPSVVKAGIDMDAAMRKLTEAMKRAES